MISKQEVLKIVAEKHSLIIGDDDPILSVLAVSDAIYDIYTMRLSEQMSIISASNTKLFTQKALSLQKAAADSARQIVDDSRRDLNMVLEDSRSAWQNAFALALEKNRLDISESQKIRSHILIGNGAVIICLIMLSLVIWMRGI